MTLTKIGYITFRKCCNCEGSPKEVRAMVQLKMQDSQTCISNNYKQQGFNYPICSICKFSYYKVDDTEGTKALC